MNTTFKLDLNEIKKQNLNVQEYMTLRYLYHRKKDDWDELLQLFGPVSSMIMNSLQSKGFIKICNDAADCTKMGDVYELRVKSLDLFEGNVDYFLKWLIRFPIKTPSGRYLSTKGEDTIMGKKLRKKWNSLFKNDTLAMSKAIDVLDAEMEWRRKNGKFEFMHNAETWLNQGDFEKYEYLLQDKEKQFNKLREDFE